MKTATNLPTLAEGFKVRLGRKSHKLELIALPPVKEVEAVSTEVPAIQTPAYQQAALELDAAVYELEKAFTKVSRPVSVPVSPPAAVFPIVAKLYNKPLPQAPKLDISQKGTLGSNKGFSLYR